MHRAESLSSFALVGQLAAGPCFQYCSRAAATAALDGTEVDMYSSAADRSRAADLAESPSAFAFDAAHCRGGLGPGYCRLPRTPHHPCCPGHLDPILPRLQS